MPLFDEISVEWSLQITDYMLVTFKICDKIVPVNQHLCILLIF